MYGEKKERIVLPCSVCEKPVVINVDMDDVRRGIAEKLDVMDSLVDREGKPYVTPYEGEMFITGTCESCWNILCPDPETNKEVYN